MKCRGNMINNTKVKETNDLSNKESKNNTMEMNWTKPQPEKKTSSLPGQQEKGKLPSSSLTKLSYTTFEKLRISAQKFPCFIPKMKRKVLKKVVIVYFHT